MLVEEEEEAERAGAARLPKELTLFNGISLVIGTIIGSGIFASPGSVLRHSHSGGTALLVWSLSGVLALTGALSYAELATRLPSSGGEVRYLKVGWGPFTSLLFTLTNVFITRPCALGIISLVFGDYLCRIAFTKCNKSVETFVIALVCAFSCTAFNMISTKFSASILNVSTSLKVMVLGSIILSGLVVFSAALAGNPINGRSSGLIAEALGFNYNITGDENIGSDIPQALLSALWAYDGWNALNYAAEEMQSMKDTVFVIKISVPIVALLYFSTNASYLIGLSFETVAMSQTVGVDLAESLLGQFGRYTMSFFVCISAFGAAMGTVFSTSRLTFSAARDDGHLPAVFGTLNSVTRTPIWALALNFALTLFYLLLVGDFDELISVFGSATWTFYLLTVLCLLRLKVRGGEDPEYKAPWIAPIVFCIVSISLVIAEAIARPVQSFSAMLAVILGGLFSSFCVKRCRRQLVKDDGPISLQSQPMNMRFKSSIVREDDGVEAGLLGTVEELQNGSTTESINKA